MGNHTCLAINFTSHSSCRQSRDYTQGEYFFLLTVALSPYACM